MHVQQCEGSRARQRQPRDSGTIVDSSAMEFPANHRIAPVNENRPGASPLYWLVVRGTHTSAAGARVDDLSCS
jgi:hypothetical protein